MAPSTSSKIRVGAVNYLNTKPLVFGLEQIAPQAEIVFDLPSRLADGLASGRFDVALIPSIESFQDPTYSIISNACIGCRGPVLSVKLFSRVPPAEIKTLALDEGSRTSAALIQILLRERYGVTPTLETLPIGDSFADCSTDAVLLIGDRAMHSPEGEFSVVWDLGDEWCRWTGLPFVFAMWTARAGTRVDEIEFAFNEARDRGLQHLDEIAAQEAAGLGLTQPECVAYLRENLNFTLGPRERDGLNLFHQYASQLGFAPEGFELGQRNCATAD